MVFMDSVGLTLFIPLLQIADGNMNTVSSDINDNISLLINTFFGYLGLDVNIPNMLFLIVLLFTLKGIFFYFSSLYNAYAQQQVALKMRTSLADGIKKLSYKEYVMTDVGRLQNTVLAEVWQVIVACIQYLEAIKNVLFVIVYLGFAFFMDWRFSLLVLIGG